jgi:hypothetical protein
MLDRKQARQLALGIAVSCVRNTFLEDLHAGTGPSSETEDYSDVKVISPYGEIEWADLSRISDDEMRRLMKEVVNKLYSVLLRLDEPKIVAAVMINAQRMANKWDKPQDDKPFVAAMVSISERAMPARRKAKRPAKKK